MKVIVPASVWQDFLDPAATGMESELGLRERRATPFFRKRGKGGTYVYEDVSPEVAIELAGYLNDRGDTLLGQSIDDPYDSWEKSMRDMLRRAVKLSEQIRNDAKREVST